MAKIYARKIRVGEMTLEQVPDRWRKQVEELLAEQTESGETAMG